MTVTVAHYLVGAALLSSDAVVILADVDTSEIRDPELAEIATAVVDLAERGQAVDVPSVARRLSTSGSVVTIADVQRLADLTDRSGNAELAGQYRDILRDQNRDNDRLTFFRDLADKVQADPYHDVQAEYDAFMQAERRVDDEGGGLARVFADQILEDLRRREAGEQPVGLVPTGISTLDRSLRSGGLHPGELIIVGARPGIGKSQLAGQIAMNAARRGEPVLIMSAEMTGRQVMRRMGLEHTGLPGPIWDQVGPIEARWRDKRAEAARRIDQEVGRLPIYIHERSAPTTTTLRRVFRRHGPFRLVIFDYTSLSGDTVKSDSEERRMATIALNFQRFVHDEQVPMIALHQLSRAVESVKPFRPSMAHLRDSGQVEANAHLVWLLYRRQYYVDQGTLEPDEAEESTMEIIIAKNRDGDNGLVKVHFDGATARVRALGGDRWVA